MSFSVSALWNTDSRFAQAALDEIFAFALQHTAFSSWLVFYAQCRYHLSDSSQ